MYEEVILSQHWLFIKISLSKIFINTFHWSYRNLLKSQFRWKIVSYSKFYSVSPKYAFHLVVKSRPNRSKQPGTLFSNKNVGIVFSLYKPSIPSSLWQKKKKIHRRVITHLKLRLSHFFRVSQPPHRDLLLF